MIDFYGVTETVPLLKIEGKGESTYLEKEIHYGFAALEYRPPYRR